MISREEDYIRRLDMGSVQERDRGNDEDTRREIRIVMG